jgi:hypothetical protein
MIVVAGGVHVVVTAPRPGRMHEGYPPGGPSVPELFASANRNAGRARDTPAIEHWGPITLRGHGPVATPEGRLIVDGELIVRPTHRVSYLALEMEGPSAPSEPFDPDGPIRVVRGPDLADVALIGPFRIAALGNRVGIRLDGPRVASTSVQGASAPMVRGAIQVPPSGELIVLGPDHPVTGGYPVAGVVCGVDIGRLYARRPGAPVAFVDVSAETSRRLAAEAHVGPFLHQGRFGEDDR